MLTQGIKLISHHLIRTVLKPVLIDEILITLIRDDFFFRFDESSRFFEKANVTSEKAGDKISAFFNRLVVNCVYSRKEQKEYLPVDWDTLEYYHVPKDYKRKFNQFKKEDVYCVERNA